MSSDSDYFVNHRRSRRFPWSVYHAPLEHDLSRFLLQVVEEHPDGHVLVVGCGLLHEIDTAPNRLRFTVVDIDQRALDAVASRSDPRVAEVVAVRPEEPIDLGRRFCAVYAKEVVEHVVRWRPWLEGLRDSLVPGGRMWLSTPNYGEPWLAAIESTILEIVARRSGYSRRSLHPTRFSKKTLAEGLLTSGFEDVHVRATRTRLALIASARFVPVDAASASTEAPKDS